MKLVFILVLTLSASTLFSQWTRVEQLPSSDIFTLYHKDNILYAGGKNIIYVSRNNGQTWDSTTIIPQLSMVKKIIVYENELYAASPLSGIFKSPDGGTTWQDINAGIIPDVSDFCDFRGDLYAATLGNSIYKLNPVGRNNWLSFSNGLSGLSSIITTITGNNNALIAAGLDNGLYDYLPANSTTWEERFLLDRISPNEGAYDIITGHDTLFFAGRTGMFYMSTDNGLNWSLFGNRLVSAFSSVVNAKQALLLSTRSFDGVNLKTIFYYIKKDALQNPFVSFSVLLNFFTYRIDILGDKLWAASDRGLFFMSLADLPGISAADAPVAVILPVHIISFNVNCQSNKSEITWKTVQEQNSHHFNIERSTDGSNWTVMGQLPAAGNSVVEKSYSFTDNHPADNNFYRIAEHDLDGSVKYTSILRSSCAAADVVNLWPNPVHDKLFINISSHNESPAILRIFDGKSALVKAQRMTVLPGSNQLSIDVRSLANGIYTLAAEWNNGQMKKTVQVVKQ